jgi:site-specific recombinase XerD
MEELLKNISSSDMEKLKILLSIIPQAEPIEIVTLRVFRDEYLNLIKNSRSKSYYNSVSLALNHLTDFFGTQHSIISIRLKDVEDFIIHLQQKVNKPVSSSRGEGYRVYYRNLKAAFNKAKDWNYVKENFFIKVRLPKRQKLAPVFLNSDQLSVISEQLKNKTVKDFVMVAFHTGMRLDEIVNVRWKNVDLQNRAITVGDENFTTKGRNQRFIPMSEEAAEILVRRKTRNGRVTPSRLSDGQACVLPLIKGEKFFDYVFCKEDGEKFTGNYISRRFKKASKAAGMDDAIHFHTLRHSFASNLAQKGVPLYTIKELLGHSSISTTEIYSHLNMDSLREAIEKLDSPQPNPESGSGQALLPKGEGVKRPQIFRINSGEKR